MKLSETHTIALTMMRLKGESVSQIPNVRLHFRTHRGTLNLKVFDLFKFKLSN